MCSVGLQEILKAMCRFVELRAVSSYLIAVVAIMKRCRDRHLQLSSTACVSSKFFLSTVNSSILVCFANYAVSHVCCIVSI